MPVYIEWRDTSPTTADPSWKDATPYLTDGAIGDLSTGYSAGGIANFGVAGASFSAEFRYRFSAPARISSFSITAAYLCGAYSQTANYTTTLSYVKPDGVIVVASLTSGVRLPFVGSVPVAFSSADSFDCTEFTLSLAMTRQSLGTPPIEAVCTDFRAAWVIPPPPDPLPTTPPTPLSPAPNPMGGALWCDWRGRRQNFDCLWKAPGSHVGYDWGSPLGLFNNQNVSFGEGSGV